MDTMRATSPASTVTISTTSKMMRLGFVITLEVALTSSATRRTGRTDCNRDAPAGFAAAHG